VLSVRVSLGSITTIQLFHSTVSILGPHIQLSSSQFYLEKYGFYFPTGMDKKHKALWVQPVAYELQSTDSQIFMKDIMCFIYLLHSLWIHMTVFNIYIA